MLRPLIHDRYAVLSHKDSLGSGVGPRPTAGAVASWVPDDDARRLTAYRILAAYRDNVARTLLPDGLPDDAVRKYREYGDAQSLIVGARSALLGDQQTVTVAGLPDSDTDQPNPDQARAVAAADWLDGWARKERLLLRVLEGESDAIGLGDAVYTLGWDPVRQRPRLRVYDPGFYFPVLGLGDDDEFPDRVHIAWEETDSAGKARLHRLTWSLQPIRPARTPGADFDPDLPLYAYDDDGRPVLQPGDQLGADGFTITRRYPWQAADEKPSTITCHFTHAVWSLEDARDRLFDLDQTAATYQVNADGTLQRDVDLRLDFIPVVHVPNDAAGSEHFGLSLLAHVAQILDDLAGTDTDLQASSALVGSATLVTQGSSGTPPAGPGAHLDLPQGGNAAYLDTSKNLDALLKYGDRLLSRLSENSRVVEAALGRIDASDVPSGISLALSWLPTTALVREMRLVRAEKYPLLLRFALRMAQAAGKIPPGPTPAAALTFGSFMPTDLAELVKRVSELLKAKAISRPTAVRMLVEGGLPIDDALGEVERIQHGDFEGANELVEATGDPALAYGYLGLTSPGTDPAGGPPVPEV